jgi:hypothetical protein
LIGIAAPREDGVNVNDAIAAALARQRGLNFAPGAELRLPPKRVCLFAAFAKSADINIQALRDKEFVFSINAVSDWLHGIKVAIELSSDKH